MDITSFIIYCFIVTVTPGPTNIVILSTVHNYGSKKAMEYTYGATIAFGLLLGISAMLNTVLITVIPKILIGMQIIGTVYMLYLSYQIYKMDTSETKENKTGNFISGFLTQFLNPKVVLFTMTVIPSFVLPYYTDMPAVTISVIVITIIGLLAFIIWVLFGAIFKKFLQKHKRVVNVVMALSLVYATVMIWI
ncbi:LysE family translocator [Oceanobacillus polygoni]|uniref:Threonine/homoserine/homoserine lactone efflux protein n=1 Tax=Oceanobacillus polygoni TaxID=1235259 RepID=A0A9X0YTY0_9BACI|nr:LysE family transporter [Oceanobacillus polygoni]MBP2078795.1 threonine/homoserine/homoserine lactone efflux protein [Oceanobacillus polygoni]